LEFGGRLVRGSFGLLAGPGEVGKGMVFMDTMARFTSGDPFPGDTVRRAPANVLICVVEDSMGRVKSRLRAAGADLDRVFFVEGPEIVRGGLKMPSPIMLDDDASAMVRRAKEVDAKALFLETAVEHFGDRGGNPEGATALRDLQRIRNTYDALAGAATGLLHAAFPSHKEPTPVAS
jgi:hypothetical protein